MAHARPMTGGPTPAKPPSCGNQPANFSLTARRQPHTRQPQHDEARGAGPFNGDGRLALPIDGK